MNNQENPNKPDSEAGLPQGQSASNDKETKPRFKKGLEPLSSSNLGEASTEGPDNRETPKPEKKTPGKIGYVPPEIAHLVDGASPPHPAQHQDPLPPPPPVGSRSHQDPTCAPQGEQEVHAGSCEEQTARDPAKGHAAVDPDPKQLFRNYNDLVKKLHALEPGDRAQAAPPHVMLPILQHVALNLQVDSMKRLQIISTLSQLVPEEFSKTVDLLLSRGLFYQMTSMQDVFHPEMFIQLLRPVFRDRYAVADPEGDLILDRALSCLSRSFLREPVFNAFGQLLARQPEAAKSPPSRDTGKDFSEYLHLLDLLRQRKEKRVSTQRFANAKTSATPPGNLDSFRQQYDETCPPAEPVSVPQSDTSEVRP